MSPAVVAASEHAERLGARAGMRGPEAV